MTDKGYPGLVLLIIELEKLVPPEELVQEDKEGSDEEILISIQSIIQEDMEVPEYRDSSPPLLVYDDSDVESYTESIDSIQRNADFVALEQSRI